MTHPRFVCINELVIVESETVLNYKNKSPQQCEETRVKLEAQERKFRPTLSNSSRRVSWHVFQLTLKFLVCQYKNVL